MKKKILISILVILILTITAAIIKQYYSDAKMKETNNNALVPIEYKTVESYNVIFQRYIGTKIAGTSAKQLYTSVITNNGRNERFVLINGIISP